MSKYFGLNLSRSFAYLRPEWTNQVASKKNMDFFSLFFYWINVFVFILPIILPTLRCHYWYNEALNRFFLSAWNVFPFNRMKCVGRGLNDLKRAEFYRIQALFSMQKWTHESGRFVSLTDLSFHRSTNSISSRHSESSACKGFDSIANKISDK